MIGPLDGIRVVDASMGAVGPWAGALLGQLGADVIKLESPRGDFIRGVMPRQNGFPTTYISMNVNKRGVILDVKKEEQRAQAHALLREADVFLENFRPGVADRIGLGWKELSALNARLVYASACGYGRTGPLASVGATDPHVQAFTGSTSVNGAEGAPRQRIRWYAHFDVNTSLCIVQGILAALLERERTGKGRLVLTSMVEAALALQRVRLAEHLAGGHPRAMGSGTTYLVPDQMFRALDGFVAVSATSERQFEALCEALQRPDLARDVRFRKNSDRVVHREALIAELESVLSRRPVSHWVRTLSRSGVPCAKPISFDGFRYHLHYRENGMLIELDTVHWGKMTLSGTPWKFRRHPVEVKRGPEPGEHTKEVLAHGWERPS